MPSKKLRITIQFFDTCYWSLNQWVDERDGLRQISKARVPKGATQFRTLADADTAAKEYSLDRGYTCEAFMCERCKHHHIRQSQAPREIPEGDGWSSSRRRAHYARIAEEQAARRAEENRARTEKAGARLRLQAAKQQAKASLAAGCKAHFAKVKRVLGPRVSLNELRAQRRAAGLCTACGLMPNPGRKLCEDCRVYFKQFADRARQRKKAALSAPAVPVVSEAPACL